MFYISNLDNQIVAADQSFLSYIGMKTLQELFGEIACNRVTFDTKLDNSVEIITGTKRLSPTIHSYPLSTVMGNLLLVQVSETVETIAPIDEIESSDTFEIHPLDAAEQTFDYEEAPKPEEFIKLEIENEPKPEEAVSYFDTNRPEEIIPLVSDRDENTINLLPDEHIPFINISEEVETEISTLPPEKIVIDLKSISDDLGISQEDLSGFLDEFVDQAIIQEENIKNAGSAEQANAIASLQKLSEVLRLSSLTDILGRIEKSSGEEAKTAIHDFYQSLSTLSTHPIPSEQFIPVFETKAEEPIISFENQICDLNLDGIKPIHFDFQPEKAADDLSLPVDLIREFVGDFIVQANEEVQIFKDACRSGDIDKIHKTAHKLKGAASNLRIVPLAQTLEELQFCEERSRFEPLLKKYWGQFLAFEMLMKNISNKKS